MAHNITLLPGDGIGPEIVDSVLKIIDAVGVEVNWDRQEAGIISMEQCGESVPKALIDSINKNKIALKGPITTPVGKGFRSVNVTLRQELNLYSNLRPVKTIAGVPSRYDDVDLVIVRENTEGLYIGIEREVSPGVTEATKLVTEKASRRIAEYAFKYAQENNRKKITMVHKANIMKITDGLFLETFRDVAKKYPDIIAEDKIIDALCMNLVTDPAQFDILLLGNLFGDIVSDLAAGLVGGLGVVPGANIGDDIAVYEAVHGTAPDIAGKNLANPTALLFSAVLMLNDIGEKEAADKIWKASTDVLLAGKIVTGDLGGSASTTEYTDEILRVMN